MTVKKVLAMKEATDVTAQVRGAQANVDARGRRAKHDAELAV